MHIFPPYLFKNRTKKESGLQTSAIETVDVCQLTLSVFRSTGGGMVMGW